MTQVATLVSPDDIPGLDIDPHTISTSAAAIAKRATAITTSAGSVTSGWAGLSTVYQAPESPTLLAAMDPVTTETTTLTAHLASISSALDTLASDLAAPVAELKRLKTRAQDFVDSVKNGVQVTTVTPAQARFPSPGNTGTTHTVDWRDDPGTVYQNEQLLRDIADQVAKIHNAEADCADTINRLREDVCLAPVAHVDGYSLSMAADNPWGRRGQGRDTCQQSSSAGLDLAVTSALQGGARLFGGDLDPDLRGSWGHGDVAGQAWTGVASGLGALVLTTMPPISVFANLPTDWTPDGPVKDFQSWYQSTMRGVGEGIVGDPALWADNPAKAGSFAAANILSFLIPGGGEAAAGVKVGTAAARLGLRISEVAADGGRIADGLVHVGELLTKGGNLLVKVHGGQIVGFDDALKALDEIPESKVLVDTPPATAGDHLGTGDHEPVTVGAGSEHTGTQHAGSEHPGGGTTTADRPGAGAPDHGGTSVGDHPDTPASDRPGTGADGAPGSTSEHDAPAPTDHSAHEGSDGPSAGAAPARQEVGAGSAPAEYPRPDAVHELTVPSPGPRTQFASRTDLQPDTVYHVEGRGDFYTNSRGTVDYVETTYGGKGSLNPDLQHPLPNTTYVVHPTITSPIDGVSHAHVFETDDVGRVVVAHTDAYALGVADRSASVQSRVGDLGGDGYDGGHSLATSAGGGGEIVNVDPMLAEINRGGGDSFYNFERGLRDLAGEHPGTVVDVTVFKVFPDDASRVPSAFEVEYRIDGGEWQHKDFPNVH